MAHTGDPGQDYYLFDKQRHENDMKSEAEYQEKLEKFKSDPALILEAITEQEDSFILLLPDKDNDLALKINEYIEQRARGL